MYGAFFDVIIIVNLSDVAGCLLESSGLDTGSKVPQTGMGMSEGSAYA